MILNRRDPSFIATTLAWVDRNAIKVAIGAITCVVIVAVVMMIAMNGLRSSPKWWSRVDSIRSDDPLVIERGVHLENAITTQMTMVRDPLDPQWAAAMTPYQVNAWLASRLVETVNTHQGNNAWPSEIERVRVAIDNDELVVGARVVHASGSSIVWAHVELELDEQGELWARLSRVHVGSTPVPIGTLSALSADHLSTSKLKIGRGYLELGDGRVAKLIALRINRGQLEVVMETSAIH